MTPRIMALAVGTLAIAAFAVWLVLHVHGDDGDDRDVAAPHRRIDAGVVLAPTSTPRATPRARKQPLGSEPATPTDPAVARDLADPDPKIRLAAVNRLIEEGDDPVALLAASRDRDEAVSSLATEGLGKLYAAGRIPLAELAVRHEDRNLSGKTRTAALEAIGQVSSDEGGRFLADIARRGDLDQRRAAAMLLVRQPRAIAVPALRELAGDGDATTRQLANASLKALAAE